MWLYKCQKVHNFLENTIRNSINRNWIIIHFFLNYMNKSFHLEYLVAHCFFWVIWSNANAYVVITILPWNIISDLYERGKVPKTKRNQEVTNTLYLYLSLRSLVRIRTASTAAFYIFKTQGICEFQLFWDTAYVVCFLTSFLKHD